MGPYQVRLIGSRLLLVLVLILLPRAVAFGLDRQFDLSMFVLIAALIALGFASWKLEATAREMRDGR